MPAIKPRWVLAFVAALSLLAIVLWPAPDDDSTTVLAQDASSPECQSLITTAVQRIGSACAAIGRNEVCYGHTRVSATLSDAALIFETSGDIVDVLNLEALFTRPSDPQTGEWGIARLDVQADVPASSGELLHLVMFGDAELTPQSSDAPAADLPTCTFSSPATTSLNMRAGPGSAYAIIDILDAGTSTEVYAQNADGLWVRSPRGWVLAPNGTLACAGADLMTVDDPTDTYVAPMQRLTMAVNSQGQCTEAPSGLLIQAPEGQVANVLVNGVELRVGSTAYATTLQNNQQMVIANFDNDVTATIGTSTYLIPVGTELQVPLDNFMPSGPPLGPRPYTGPSQTLANELLLALPDPVSRPGVGGGGTTGGVPSGGGQVGPGGTTGDGTTGQWGACGSCDTCGYVDWQCRLNPDGACVWDPADCAGLDEQPTPINTPTSTPTATPTSTPSPTPTPMGASLDCGDSYTCDFGDLQLVACQYSGSVISDYDLSSEGILPFVKYVEANLLYVEVDCSVPSTSDFFSAWVDGNLGPATDSFSVSVGPQPPPGTLDCGGSAFTCVAGNMLSVQCQYTPGAPEVIIESTSVSVTSVNALPASGAVIAPNITQVTIDCSEASVPETAMVEVSVIDTATNLVSQMFDVIVVIP